LAIIAPIVAPIDIWVGPFVNTETSQPGLTLAKDHTLTVFH
jgi:hypothetical protein